MHDTTHHERGKRCNDISYTGSDSRDPEAYSPKMYGRILPNLSQLPKI